MLERFPGREREIDAMERQWRWNGDLSRFDPAMRVAFYETKLLAAIFE